jgi:hypothetical protein
MPTAADIKNRYIRINKTMARMDLTTIFLKFGDTGMSIMRVGIFPAK